MVYIYIYVYMWTHTYSVCLHVYSYNQTVWLAPFRHQYILYIYMCIYTYIYVWAPFDQFRYPTSLHIQYGFHSAPLSSQSPQSTKQNPPSPARCCA